MTDENCMNEGAAGMKRHQMTLIVMTIVMGLMAGVAQAAVLSIDTVYGHNEKTNYDGKINDMIIGSGMNGNGVDGDPDWPIPGVSPSTWTVTSSAYQSEWVSGDLLDDESPVNGKIGWTVFDVGSIVTNLDSLYLWNVRNGSTSYSASFNVYVAETPTNTVPHGPTGGTSTDYDFASGGWTLINTGGALTGTYQGNQVVDLSGNNGRYVAIEILTNGSHGDRTGFAEVGITYFDTAAPVVLTLSPTNSATGVPTHSDLVMTFDEIISTNAGNVTITNITDATSSVIAMGDAQISVSGAELTIDQSAFMDLGDTYAVLLDSGAVTDLSANDFGGISSTSIWQFVTTGQAAPTSTVNAATDIYAISATMNAVLSAGGEGDAWLVWGTSVPGTPDDKDSWANTVPLGTVSQDDAIATNYTTLSTSTTYYYRLYVTNTLGTSWSATNSFTTASAINTMSATAGGNDSWNDPSNWSEGFTPRETQQAVVAASIGARVDNAALEYTGGLILNDNASILVGYGTDVAAEMNVLDSSVTMNEGTKVIFRRGNDDIPASFDIQGTVQIDGTSSTAGHNTTRNFNGAFSGPGSVTFWSGNNNTFNINAAGTISGSVHVVAANCSLVANVNGAFGTADVYSDAASSLVIASSLSDTIDNDAELHLNGAKDSGQGGKLVLNSGETVFGWYIDDVQQPGGTYSSSHASISGGGTLTVLDSPISITNTAAVSILHDTADLVSELYGPSEDYDVYLHYGTNDNADAAAWLADTTATRVDLGSFSDYDNVAITGSVSSLTPSTTYYYTMMATNVKKFAWATPNATFDSLPPPAPPTVSTNSGPSALIVGGATLNGVLIGGGSADAWICWGNSDGGTGSTGDWENVISMGPTVAQGAPFATDVTGLLYGNTYSYRAYVSNVSGSNWSAVATFGPAAPAPSGGGEIAVYREVTGTELITTLPFDHEWDTTERENSGAYSLNANGYEIECAAGHHLVLYSSRFDDPANNGSERSEIQTQLRLNGVDLPIGWSQGFTRRQDNDFELICSGGGIIDVENGGDPLILRSFRTDADGDTMQREPGASGVQLLKLSDDWDYCRLAKSSSVGLSSTAFIDVTYDQQDELDAGTFSHTSGSGDITLKTAGHYLVLANTYMQFASQSTDNRSSYEQRLALDGTAVAGTVVTVYLRGNSNSDSACDGATAIGTIIETDSDDEVLSVEIRKEFSGAESANILGGRTAVTIVKLPDDGEYIRLDDSGTDGFNPSSGGMGWDNELENDSAGFTHSDSQVGAAVDDDYLFFTKFYDNDDGNQRIKWWQRWRKNGADYLNWSSSGRYSRNSENQANGNFSGLIASMTAGDYIEVLSEQLGNSGTMQATDKGLQGVRLGSIAGAADSIAVTSATNILSSTADLQGTLAGADAVYTVTAFWSESNNVGSVAWLADGTASSDVIGTYSNVPSQAITASASSLDAGTTYYYTLRAHNAFTSYWASANAIFDTLAPPSPPAAGLNGGATGIGIGTAMLQGVMTNTAAAQAYICYGASDGGTNLTTDWDTVIDMGIASDGITFSNDVSGLLYGVEYNYRVFVTNDAGSGWSAVDSFTTLVPGGAFLEETGWSYAAWTGDTDSGIDSDRTYTAAQCFGDNHSGSVTVNGVTFTENLDQSGTGWSATGLGSQWTGDDDAAITGDSEDLAEEFRYSGSPFTFQLSGLTAGTRYRLTLFSVAWEDGSRIQTFVNDASTDSLTVNQDLYGNNNGISISYAFDATSATEDFSVTTGGFHCYALACRDVEEEAGVGIANTTATNVADTTATLQGSLDATGSVFTATAYWSTNDNADGTAWLADGDAANQGVGSYTNVMGQDLSTDISGLTQEVTYYYTLLASNAATNMWASSNATFTTVIPRAVSNLTVSAVGTDTASLNANIRALGAAVDVVAYWGTTDGLNDAGAWDTNVVVGSYGSVLSSNISFAATGLDSAQTYYYTFRETNATASVWASPSETFTTRLGPAQAPTFTGASATWAGAELTWADNTTVETGYILQRSSTGAGGTYSVVATLAADITSYSDATAAPETEYYYQLAATSSVTESSTDFAICQTNATTGVKPYSQLGVLNVDANGGVNPATGALWAEGDQYRLVFVTSDRRDATSVFIDDYNAFVQGAAEGSSAFPALADATWKAIASTALVDARDNTETNPGEDGTGVSIFKLNSVRIADNYTDLWDGSIDSGLNLTEENANSTSHDGAWGQYHGVWTGTGSGGTEGSALGSASPTVALAGQVNGYWMSRGGDTGTKLAYVNAMSEPLTMRGPVTVLNQEVTDVVSTQATANAELLIPAASADVVVYWGPSDGGSNPAAWASNAVVGSYSPATSTNISHTIGGLTSGQVTYYTFFASNSTASYWASPSASFTALAVPVVDNAGGATAILDTTATLNGNMSEGGLATVYVAWGDDSPASPADTSNWDTVVQIDAVTDNTPFSTDLTGLTGETTYYYSCFATNTQGGDWSPVTNFTTLSTVNRMTSGGGNGSDSWNVPGNWSLGHVVSNAENAVISAGVQAWVESLPPAYTGSLVIESAARLDLEGAFHSTLFPVAGQSITMRAGSQIVFQDGGGATTINSDIIVDGAVTFTQGGNGSHHEYRAFYGEISGTGPITYYGNNNNAMRLYATNTFTGGLTVRGFGNGDLDLYSDGAAGSGDLTMLDNTSLRINSGLSDTIDDSAALYLIGGDSTKMSSYKLTLNSSETVHQLWLDGVQLDGGAYTKNSGLVDEDGSALITGNGTLTVIDWPASIANNSAVNIATNAADMVGTLDAINETFSVYLYWSENDNADSTAWLADGTASSISVGSFSDELAVTGSVSTLLPLTEYYYTMVASNATEGTIWASPNASFITPGPPTTPTVTTGGGAANIDIGTATLRGLLTAGGQGNAWICYGATDGGTSSTSDWDNVVSVGGILETVAFSNNVSGLLYGIEYEYRVYVSNVAGSDWSDVDTFKTAAPEFPNYPTDGLVGLWTFDDDSADDQSGGGHDGTWTGTPVYSADTPSGAGKSVDLNGNKGIVAGGDENDFDVDRITIATWVKEIPDGSWEPYIAKRGESNQGYQLRRRSSGDDLTWTFRATPGSDDPDDIADRTHVVADNPTTWHHLVARYDGSRRQIVVNGDTVNIALDTSDSGDIPDSSYPLSFGGRNSGSSWENYCNTWFDDIFFYDRAITDDEVAQLYGIAGAAGYYPGYGITNTGAVNILAESADLVAELDATQSVFTVTAYWSTNDNADGAAWLADGSASSEVLGSFTNVMDHEVTLSIDSLTASTTYYYTMLAGNASTNLWATPNATFITLDPPAQPAAGLAGGATGVALGAATLNGVMSDTVAAQAYLVWGDNDADTNSISDWDTIIDMGVVSENVTFSNTLSAVYYGPTYSYRVYVTNAAGQGWSAVDTFSVSEPPAGGGVVDLLGNAGFEVPDQGASGYAYQPAGATWTFASGSGLSGPTGPWKCDSTSPDPLGDQFAYMQGATTISQTLSGLTPGSSYYLTFYESYRTGTSPDNDLKVILDEGMGSEVTIYSTSAVNNATWEQRQTDTFVPTKSSYTLTFRTTHPIGSGDRTTIIDGVVVTLDQTGVGIANTSASGIADTTADLQGTLHAMQSVFTVTAYWSTNDNADATAWLADGSASSQVAGTYTNVSGHGVSTSVSGLTGGTTYYYTLRASNPQTNIWATPNVSLATLAQPVVGLDGGAQSAGTGSVSLRGLLSAGGAANATICWGQSDGGTTGTDGWDHVIPVGVVNQGAAFSNTVSDLYYGPEYNYRVYVTNGVGHAWSALHTFFMDLPPSVGVQNGAATGITDKLATIGGGLDATQSIFTVSLYWSESDNADGAAWLADGSADSRVVSTFTNVQNVVLSESLSELTPDTTYYYTYLAANSATNMWASPNGSFSTFDSLTVSNLAATAVTRESATLNARLLVAGASADVYAYWGTSDGTVVPASWDTNAFVGTWTNVINTNISYVAGGMDSEQTYYYRFFVSNGLGTAWASPAHTLLTQLGSDQTPVFGTPTTSYLGANLTWTDNADYETGYIVRRSSTGAGGSYTVLATLAADATSYSDTTGAELTTYHYQVAATSSVTQSSTDFADAVVEATTAVKPYSQLGVLNVDANGGVNPATGAAWAEGDQYRLAFLTSARTNATSFFIDDYNAFVQNVANGSVAKPTLGDATWKAIASTALVDARDNTEANPGEDGTGVGIFKLNTVRLANNYSDLWDGSIDSNFYVNEEGANNPSHDGPWGSWRGTWTGSSSGGTADTPLGSASPMMGLAQETSGQWMRRGTGGNTGLGYMYAMSEPLTMRGLITVINQAATDINSTSATVRAELLIPATSADVTVYWGTTDGGTTAGSWTTNETVGSWSNKSSTNVSLTITGLTAGQTYYYTFFASNGVASYWGDPSESFTALSMPIVDNVSGASAILDTTATLNGNMSQGGLATAYIAWGDDSPASPEDTNNWDTVVEIGSATDNSPFSTDITGLTGETVYYYSCFVTNAIGGDWSPVTNFTTLSVVNTMDTSGDWHDGANWSLSHAVSNTENAVIGVGIAANANNAATLVYTGSLTLSEVASVTITQGTAEDRVFGGAGKTITMNNGSKIACGSLAVTINQPIDVVGSATIQGGWSTTGHHQNRTLAGAVSGGQLVFNGVNNNTYHLNASNTFSGFVAQSTINAGQDWRVEANASGALGSGDVTINDSVSLQVDAVDVMADTAVLALNGTKDGGRAAKLVMNANDTVYQLWIDGVQQDGGDYTSSASFLSGSGTLTVLDWPASITNTAAVNIATNAADMVGILDAINETFDVTVYWSENDNADSTAWLADGSASSLLIGTFSNEVAVTGSVSTLNPLTTYYYTMMAENVDEGMVWATPNASFMTPGSAVAPTVTTGGGATGIDIGTATLRGLLSAGGLADAYVCYGMTDGGTGSTGDWANVASIGEVIEGVAFSNTVNGLLYGIEYDYRVYVSNVAGSDWSEVATFKSSAPILAPVLPVDGNLVAHYDAGVGVTSDGSGVTTWEDQSGNDYHATRASGTPTAVADALNERPEIQCRNKNSYFNVNHNIFVKEQYVVGRSANATWNNYGAYFANKSGREGSYLFENNNTGFHGNKAPAEVSRDGVVKSTGSSGVLTPMQEYMVLKIVVNDNNTTPRQYYVGRSDHSTADLDVLEIIGYGTALSDSDEDLVGGYLAYKYGIGTSYPSYAPPAAISVSNTLATSVAVSSAVLQGVLDATQSVFTVHAYVSEDNNANGEAWLTDGGATSVLIGSYTNINNQPLSIPVTGLSGSTTYYYTLRASNASTTIWAATNATFDTLWAPSASMFMFK
jgi:hypothetical protein